MDRSQVLANLEPLLPPLPLHDVCVHSTLVGAGGGIISMALTYPLITISSRLQVQKDKSSKDAYKVTYSLALSTRLGLCRESAAAIRSTRQKLIHHYPHPDRGRYHDSNLRSSYKVTTNTMGEGREIFTKGSQLDTTLQN